MSVAMATCKHCGSADTVDIREEITDRSQRLGEVVGRTRHCKACGRTEELPSREKKNGATK
jgi:hypothetical protein